MGTLIIAYVFKKILTVRNNKQIFIYVFCTPKASTGKSNISIQNTNLYFSDVALIVRNIYIYIDSLIVFSVKHNQITPF